MHEDLHCIDWKSLRHAYGPAEDVPRQLRALASDDASIRDEALGELFSNIYHQGTVYPASAAALPFLYELLAAPDVQGKSWIALLLASIADGVGYLEVHARPDRWEKDWRRLLEKKGLTLEDELARESGEIAAVRMAASPRLRDLLPYLADDEAEVRRCVASALARYPEHRAWTRPALESALRSEDDEDVREAIATALEHLPRSESE